MASRAHVIHDFPSYPDHSARVRRVVRYRDEDPVVLPRTSIWSSGAGLIGVALAAAAIVGGSAYAAYHPELPAMAETPAAPLEPDWQPLPATSRAAVTNVLSGPAHAAPERATPNNELESNTPIVSGNSSEATLDELAPAEPSHLPQTAPNTPPTPEAAPVVPNPTTTPPDAIAPPSSTPETPTPVLDPENPYR